MDNTQPQWFQFPAQVPSEVNGFRLKRLLGEGGMGLVYEAFQKEPITRRVAIKFLKCFRDQERMMMRFKLETQTLAQMNHPNIAVIHDTGFTDAGQPYLVMELVEGIPLDKFCAQKKLTVQERVSLFLQVCSGVTHAHQKGIIHRDLKPENLLVTEMAGEQTIKIIDFGIAKEFQQDKDCADGKNTRAGELLGTPYYISPEQANGEYVDIRTDVFSLGVVLFQLLTGVHPYGAEPQGFVQYLNRMLKGDAPRPSDKITATRETLGRVASERSATPDQLIKEIRQDLDWVALKSLADHPDQRYQSVSELANDLKRYLAGKPIEARPKSNLYTFRKFIRRHKMGVFAFSGVFISLILALIISIYSLNRIRNSEKEARRSQVLALKESEKSYAINSFLKDLLASPNPLKDGKDVKVLDLFNEHRVKLNQFQGTDMVKAEIMNTLGSTYYSLSQYPEALKLMDEAWALGRVQDEISKSERFKMEWDLWHVHMKMGHYKESESGLRAMLKEYGSEKDSLQGDPVDFDPVLEAKIQALLGEDLRLMANYEEALPILERSWKTLKHHLGANHEEVRQVKYQNGITLWSMGRLEESERLLRETLEHRLASIGLRHPRTLENMGSLANVLFRQGKWAQSEDLHRRVYQTRLEFLGPEHHATLFSQNNIGSTLYKQKKYEEALEFAHDSVNGFTKILGQEHPDTLMALNNLGNIYRKQKNYQMAVDIYQRALRGQLFALGNNHTETNRTRFNLIRVLQSMNRMEESLPYCEQGIMAMPKEPWGYNLKAKALLARGDYQRAVPVLEILFKLESDDLGFAIDLIISLAEIGDFNRGNEVLQSIKSNWTDEVSFDVEIMQPLAKKAQHSAVLKSFLSQTDQNVE